MMDYDLQSNESFPTQAAFGHGIYQSKEIQLEKYAFHYSEKFLFIFFPI